MESKLKQLWFKTFIGFHLSMYLIPIIIRIITAWLRDLSIYWLFSEDFLNSILLFSPIGIGLIAWISYYYVYELENKNALKFITIFSFLLCFIIARGLHHSGTCGWHAQYYIEIMIKEALILYALFFYFIANYRLYKTIKSAQNILPSIIISSIGLAILILLKNSLFPTLGCILIILGLLPDFIQITALEKSKSFLLKTFKKA